MTAVAAAAAHALATGRARQRAALYSCARQQYASRALSKRALPLLVLVLALSLGGWARLGALKSGFWADDYAQFAMLDHVYPSQRASWDLFHFVDGSVADLQRIMDFGVDPWWTHPHFRLSLLRPLPSLLCAFDHAVFRMDAAAQHMHSLLWWGLLVVVVALLFFSILPPLAAAVAVVLFSLDESQTVPVLWLSNRSALVATTFSLAALYCHARWRRTPTLPWRVASIAVFVIALSCGEYALASCGYIVCMEAGAHFTGQSRTRALAPMLALTATFLGLSAWLGYGSAHSALYTSPFSAPLAYATKLSSGIPALIGELVLGVPADWWSFGSPWPGQLQAISGVDPATWAHLPTWHFCQVCLGLLGAALALGALFWLRRRVDSAHYRTLQWLTAGALLGLLPVLGSFVTTRLVLPSSVGFAALFGSIVAEGIKALVKLGAFWQSRSTPPPRAPSEATLRWSSASVPVIVASLVLYIHGYRAWNESRRTTDFYSYVAQSRTWWPLTAALDEQRSASQRLVMIAAADANDAPYLPFVRFAFGRPILRGFRLLSGSPGAHEVSRLDANTIELRVLDDFGLTSSVAGSLTREQNDWLAPGQVFNVSGMRVEVLETRDGQPVHMRYRFDVPVEDPGLVFVHSTPQGLQRIALPMIGERVRLAPPTMPDMLLLTPPSAARR